MNGKPKSGLTNGCQGMGNFLDSFIRDIQALGVKRGIKTKPYFA